MTKTRPFRTTRQIVNLRQGRNDWYRIQASASADGPNKLYIYDEIGYFGVTASDMVADLAGVKGDLEVHLNTPGGDVFEGVAIYEQLSQRDGLVRVLVDGLAASAGSIIAMAADPGNLIIAPNASMMIHEGFSMGVGDARDMRKLADLLDEQSANIANIYAARTGQPADHWRDQMLAETWYVGQKAVDAGLADFVRGNEPEDAAPAAKLAATWDLSIFARRPGQPVASAAEDPPAAGPEQDPPAEPPADPPAEAAPGPDAEPVLDGQHDEDPVPDTRMHTAFLQLTGDMFENIRSALEGQ
jgi:ATP-dependent protease ClpP protease subunit